MGEADASNQLPFYMCGEGDGDETVFKEYVAVSFKGSLMVSKQVSGAALASLTLNGHTYLRNFEEKCQKESVEYLPECNGPEKLLDIGNTKIKIDKFLISALVENQPIPVMDIFGMTSALAPTPNWEEK